jgi:subtilisin family serine protease/Ca2+-binding RTX toxin-like protein
MAIASRHRRRSLVRVESVELRTLLSAMLDLIGATALRADPLYAGIDGGGTSVAIIDTGLDTTHPLLSTNYRAGYNAVTGGSTPTVTNGHGTHVAGIVAGKADASRNYDGGVAPGAGLVAINVFSQIAGGDVGADNNSIQRALQWVLDNRATYNIVSVNMSLGSGFYTSASQANGELYADEIDRLEAAGVSVVSAAGNSYGLVTDPSTGQTVNQQRAGLSSPAILSTLAVGAVWEGDDGSSFYWTGTNTFDQTTAADAITSFSQRPLTTITNGIFAPGANILSTWPGNQLQDSAGTSMASPVVAGAVALLQDAALTFGGRLLSSTEVQSILRTTGDTITDNGNRAFIVNDANGNGRVDSGETTPLTTTGFSYKRLNVYSAVKYVRSLFAGSGVRDANGTLASSINLGSIGASPSVVDGVIGSDGSNTSVGTRDVDLYQFTVDSPGKATLTLGSATTSPADFNALLRLFDAGGTQLATTNFGGTISRDLTPGVYYLGVSGAGNSSYSPIDNSNLNAGKTGRFSLSLRIDSNDPDGVLSGAKSLDVSRATVGGAPVVGVSASIGKDGSRTVGAGDVDIYKVIAPDDGSILIDIDTPASTGYVDSYLRVFNEAGTVLAASDDGNSTDLSGAQDEFTSGSNVVNANNVRVGHTVDAFVSGTVSRGTVYYVAVSDFRNQSYSPTSLASRNATGTGGTYTLSITFRNNDTNGSIVQPVDATALPLVSRGGTLGFDFGSTVGDRDVDLLKVRPDSTGILEVNVDSYSIANNTDTVDTVITLYDAQGNKLASIDDVNGSPDPLLQMALAPNADYYVAISGKGNDTYDPFILGSGSVGDTGQYQVSIRLRPASDGESLSDGRMNRAPLRSVSVGSSVSASVGYDNAYVVGNKDVDLYTFTPTSTGSVVFRAVPTDAYGADPIVRLFDANGAELAYNDNATGSTVEAAIRYSVQQGVTYLVGVSGSGNRSYNPVSGNGTAKGASGAYTLTLTSSPVPAVPARSLVVQGTPDDDRINVFASASTIRIDSNGGSTEYTRSAFDFIHLFAGDGADRITLDAGVDLPAYVDAGAGNDSVVGGSGNDTLTAGSGKNTLVGGAGSDRLNGSGGRDLLKGGEGNDRLYGNAGDDTLYGEGGVDRLFGGAGNDLLDGGSSNDKLYGDAGNDTLYGNRGADLVNGGDGTDTAERDDNDSRSLIEVLV